MDFPYTKSVGSIPRLFAEIKTVGVPTKVTVSYLKGIGFKSSNDALLPAMLKGIGFVNSGGAPTDKWTAYRGAEAGQVMAEAVREGYSALFNTYPDAHKRDGEAIANLVRQNTSYGADTVQRVVGSFKALCDLADFSESGGISATPKNFSTPDVVDVAAVNAPMVNGTSPVINLNIQLELPSQADEKFYDEFFKAMTKHLMS